MSIARQILLDTPDAYWPCTDSGAPKDLSGNGHHASLAAGANTYVTDPRWGRCIDGTAGDWQHTCTVNQSHYTMEAWVYLTSTPADDNTVLSDWGGSGATGVMLYYAPSSAVPVAYHAGNPLAAPSAISMNKWHHHLVTWDGSTRILYVDGEPVATDTQASAPGNASGSGAVPAISNYGAPGTANRRLGGNLAHLAMFPTALSADRIHAHYQAGIREMVVV